MTRGRKPIPECIGQSVIAPISQEVPAYLSKPAKKIYRKLRNQLITAGMSSILDETALAMLAANQAELEQVEKELVNASKIIEGKNGAIPNPLYRIKRQCESVIANLIKELGLSPNARKRITNNSSANQANTELDDMING